jgi:hypothetical protein
MRRFIPRRSSILAIAVVALSINALSGFVSSGGAAPATHSVQVVTGMTFLVKFGARATASPGDDTYATSDCPASYPILVTGGYQASGTYNSLLGGAPSVTTSEPTTSGTSWLVHLLDPKTAGQINLDAVALCAHLTTTTVTSG